MLKKYQLAKRAMFACYFILFAIIIFWFVQRPSGLNVTILLAQIIPLAVFIPGMALNYYRSYSWICFVLLFYFVKAVEGVLVSTHSMSDMFFLVITVITFCISMMASRWAQRLHKNGII